MAKLPVLHAHSDRTSFDRLMLLIATLVNHPGIGEDSDGNHLAAIQQQMQQLATELKLPMPWCAIPTLRKDLALLRHYGILEDRLYRHGYYLGTGAMTTDELRLAINALASQAKYQGDARARQAYQKLGQRMRGQKFETDSALFYPVRLQFNPATTYTDPDEMMRKRAFRKTLFHQLEQVEHAILQGIPLELYAIQRQQYETVYPLQLLYRDVAWYLLCEAVQTGHLKTYRMDRLSDHVRPLDRKQRGIAAQQQSLQKVHQLLTAGWGLFLGNLEEQQQELTGMLTFEPIKVRFYQDAIPLILEADRRHPKQKITRGKRDETTGELHHVDYQISLPPRSLREFGWWLNRYLGNVKVIAPDSLIQQHQQLIEQQMKRY